MLNTHRRAQPHLRVEVRHRARHVQGGVQHLPQVHAASHHRPAVAAALALAAAGDWGSRAAAAGRLRTALGLRLCFAADAALLAGAVAGGLTLRPSSCPSSPAAAGRRRPSSCPSSSADAASALERASVERVPQTAQITVLLNQPQLPAVNIAASPQPVWVAVRAAGSAAKAARAVMEGARGGERERAGAGGAGAGRRRAAAAVGGGDAADCVGEGLRRGGRAARGARRGAFWRAEACAAGPGGLGLLGRRGTRSRPPLLVWAERRGRGCTTAVSTNNAQCQTPQHVSSVTHLHDVWAAE